MSPGCRDGREFHVLFFLVGRNPRSSILPLLDARMRGATRPVKKKVGVQAVQGDGATGKKWSVLSAKSHQRLLR